MKQPKGRDINRQWWESPGLWLAFAIATSVPFLLVDIPPLTDLPNHVARFHILLSADQVASFHENYEIQWRLIGNLGVDILVRLLGPLCGAEGATRIVVGSIPPLTVLGIYCASRAINGRVGPSALLAIPLSYTWPFYTGFLNFSLSMAIALLVFAFWIRKRSASAWVRLSLFAGLSFITWVTHTAGWGLLGLSVLGFELVRAYRARGVTWRAFLDVAFEMLPFALVVAFMVLWRQESASPLGVQFEEAFVRGKGVSVISLFREQFIAWDLFWQIAFLAMVAAFFNWGGKQLNASGVVIASLCIIAFLACPTMVFGSYFADRRLLAYAAIFVPLSVGFRHEFRGHTVRRETLSLLAGIAVLLVVGRLAVTSVVWFRSDMGFKSHLALLEKIPSQSRVFSMVVEPCKGSWYRAGRILHLPQFVTIRKNGFVNGLFQESGLNQVVLKVSPVSEFDTDMGTSVKDQNCLPDYPGRSFQSAIAQFQRDHFKYLWLMSEKPLPAFDDSGLSLIESNGNDRLYIISSQK